MSPPGAPGPWSKRASKLVPCAQPVLVPAASRRPATPQHHTLLARMPPGAHDGTDGGDPAPGVPTSLRARCTCPGLQGFWLRSVRDLGAAAPGGAESTNRSAASHLVSAATRSLQPPSCPLSERRRATPHTPPCTVYFSYLILRERVSFINENTPRGEGGSERSFQGVSWKK